jgi:hypothetical protein
MEANVDKCLALCQTLAGSNHQFTFTLTIGKDTLSFSTYDQPCKGSACKGRDLKKAAPQQQRRRDRRAADPAVQQKAAAYVAAATAGQAAAGAPAQNPAPRPEMGGVAGGPACAAAEEARRDKVAKATVKVAVKASFNCDQCEYSNASEKGLKQHMRVKHKPEVKTPEKERNASLNASLNTSPVKVDGRAEACPCCGGTATPDHQCGAASLELQGAETAARKLFEESAVESPAPPPVAAVEWCKNIFCTPNMSCNHCDVPNGPHARGPLL